MFSGPYLTYMIIAGVFSVIGFLIQQRLKSVFKKYSKVGTSNRMTGAETAQKMLDHYNITDVDIQMGKGFLSDHYNPRNKTVNLSPDVYKGRSIAAAAVAAHECGHVVQHATAYKWLEMRSAIVPIVSFASRAQQWLLIFALGGIGAGADTMSSWGQTLLLITIAAFGITTLFSLITLPVEFDASNRALAWLNDEDVLNPQEREGAKESLWWAAMTYVVAALSSLVMMIWLILRFLGANE